MARAQRQKRIPTAKSQKREFIPNFHFPPGFRFHPSDEELIVHYLINKINSRPLPAYVIAEIELYNYNPWELPKKALSGKDEWYFFSPRDRKYPNGVRPNRSAASGFWKATGTDKPILNSSGSRRIGVKKTLVFYKGRPPKGVKTEWTMNEYRVPNTMTRSSRAKGSMRLDDWVLCRVRQKGNMSKNTWEDQKTPSELEVLSNLEELPSVHASVNTEINTDWPFKDCPILTSMLAGQVPPIGGIYTGTFHSLGKVKINSTSDLSGRFFNPSRESASEENRCNDLVHSNTKALEDKENYDLLPDNMLITSATHYFDQSQPQGNVLGPTPATAIMNLHELNEPAFFREDFYRLNLSSN
ncbi:hypothetical protein RJ639_045808 [Escallonia herrerae]|uniref:NAC domain-containing protein n=1 Tax=Escallonia herrerae TaxID=1293975 RepID=A0AA88W9J9_9ASTE|nr:hypothetical protein RJ639_045808 [Escallonia herrerae]